MRSREKNPVRRPAWLGLTIMLAVVLGAVIGLPGLAHAQQQNPERWYNEDGGFVQLAVQSSMTTAFEAVMEALKAGLQNSDDPVRKQQLRNWKIYKSDNQVPGHVLYIMIIEPSVKDADYTISTILTDVYPYEEALSLYDTFNKAVTGGFSSNNLELVNDFGR